MSGTRIQIDLYYKDKTPQQVNTEFPNLLPAIKALKNKASKINTGLPNEEMTVTAKYHLCRNDENKACSPEVEI